MQDDKQSGVHKHLGVGEEMPTPLCEHLRGTTQLMKQNMTRLNM
jgi:hypothetical protein